MERSPSSQAHRRGLDLPQRTSWPLRVFDSSSLDDAGPRSPTPHLRSGEALLVSRPTCRTSRISTGFTNRSRAMQVDWTWCSRTPVAGGHASARSHHRGARRPDSGTNVATKDLTPFKVREPQAALDDLKRRLASTRWPERETVGDWSQGVPLEKAQAFDRVLARQVRLAPVRGSCQRLAAIPHPD